jgi:hypothetical protein
MNEQMTARIGAINHEIPAIRMLDVIKAMVNHESKWNPEFADDDRHLRLTYIPLVDRPTSAKYPTLQFLSPIGAIAGLFSQKLNFEYP